MTSSRVLCCSADEAFAARISAPLEYSYPQVSVLTVTDEEAGVDVIETEDVDAVVSDAATISQSPALLDAIRRRRPDLSLLVLSTYDHEGSARTAVSEVVDFLDDVGLDAGDEALAGWVASSVVGAGGPAAPGDPDHLRDVVNSIKRALVDATDPVDVESAVCERLVLGDRFEFAWIGEYDRGEGQVVPWASAARGENWPRTQTFAAEDGDGVVARVLRSREPVVLDDIGEHLDRVPWRDVAIERGCTGAAFFPHETDEGLFGVMGVYTAVPDGISDDSVEALSEVASTTARVLEAMSIRGRIDQQERTLRRYRRLVETVGDGMYALDEDGHFMTVNDALCSMTGYSREGLLGEHIELVLREDGLSQWRDEVDRLRGVDADSATIEGSVLRKDGSTFPCETTVALLPSDDGEELPGTVGVLRDVTERERRERELRRQNERLDAFASIVSHDLRNPLSVARGYLEEVSDDPEHEEAVGHVGDALDRMNDMIEDVLALAREGKTVTDTESTDLASVAQSAWDNVDTASATLSLGDLPVVRADRSRLLRLFENLFRNAIEHGGSNVTVSIGSLGSDSADFYVEDDGPGMKASVREHVFESEFTTSEEGLGIGLWVVGEVADAHGWRASATSGSEGGARFEFRGVSRPA